MLAKNFKFLFLSLLLTFSSGAFSRTLLVTKVYNCVIPTAGKLAYFIATRTDDKLIPFDQDIVATAETLLKTKILLKNQCLKVAETSLTKGFMEYGERNTLQIKEKNLPRGRVELPQLNKNNINVCDYFLKQIECETAESILTQE